MSAPEPKRCLACGYILDGLPETRCPECGRVFDPLRPATYVSHQISGTARLGWALAAAVAVSVAPLLILVVHVPGTYSSAPWMKIPCVMLMWAGYVGAAALFWSSLKTLRLGIGAASHRGALLAALLVSGLICLAFGVHVVLIIPHLIGAK